MFKNYLTYNFALAFQRACSVIELDSKNRESLVHSADQAVHHFARAIHAQDRKDELRFLCVTLMCLRDCKDVLDAAKVWPDEISARYDVLHGRLEQLCVEASDAEAGQLRMLG